jgi:hypothetical protein
LELGNGKNHVLGTERLPTKRMRGVRAVPLRMEVARIVVMWLCSYVVIRCVEVGGKINLTRECAKLNGSGSIRIRPRATSHTTRE